MPSLVSQGVRIGYETAGGGPPLLLLHALRASSTLNWGLPGWVDLLAPSYRLVLVDHRGHGRSGKPHDPGAYSRAILANDALAVLDRLEIHRAAVMGYSLGTVVAVELLLDHPERFGAAILAGMGSRWAGPDERDGPHAGSGHRERLVPQLRTGLRAVGSYLRHHDGRAVRAARRGVFPGGPPVDVRRLPEIAVPVLVVAGTRDALFEPSRDLAAAIPGARHVAVPGKGHITTVLDPLFEEAVVGFLGRAIRPEGEGWARNYGA